MKKSPDLAVQVYKLLNKRSFKKDVEYATDWHKFLEKYKAKYLKIYFHEDNEESLFHIMNSPEADEFVYIRDPYNEPDRYMLRIPVEIAEKMLVLGRLGDLP